MMLKQKQTVEFTAFNDGVVSFYEVDEDNNIILNTKKSFKFKNKTIGVNRYFQARSNDYELSKLISIHKNLEIDTTYAAVINSTRYKIIQIQQVDNTNPPTTLISLGQRGLYEGDYNV